MRTIKGLKVLEKNDFEKFAPSVLTTEPSGNVSNKYSFANSLRLINDLKKNSWLPVRAQEAGTSKPEREGFQKHIVHFRNPDLGLHNGLHPEIIMTNSHDAKSSFQLRAGVFRLVCSNGLITGEEFMPAVRIRHINYDFSEVKNAVSHLTDNIPVVMGTIEQFKSTDFSSKSLRKDFELKAAQIRWPKAKSVSGLLVVKRLADKENNLWNAFNIVQENLIQGGGAKAIKSIDRIVKMNTTLWDLACQYLNN